jgi:hypothetical protein
MECPACGFDIPDGPSAFTVGTPFEVSACPSCDTTIRLVHECHPDIEWEDEDGNLDSAPGCVEFYEIEPK